MWYYVELRPFPEWQLGKIYPIAVDNRVNSEFGEKIPVEVLMDSSGYILSSDAVIACATTLS